MRHAWTRLFGGFGTFLMKQKNFLSDSFLVQILIKCGTWWTISKFANPERPAAIMKHAKKLSIDLFLKDSEGQTAFEMWPEIFIETYSEIHLKQF